MPAKGQHRKPRSLSRLTRICIAAGTGGVAIALPLVGADLAAAQGAPADVTAGVSHVVAQAPQAAPKAAPKATHYTVVRGDTLSKIATSHHVAGGWHRVYNDNKSVIGSNPNVIRPGQHLTLNGHAVAAAKKAAPAPAKKAVKPAAKPASVTTDSGYTKPVGNAAIGTPYHQAGSNWSSGYHTGVDFLVGTGTPIHAVAAGTVVSAGWDGAYGNDVIIKHADGKYTLYAHQSQLLVSAGQTVTEGQQIGRSGATGNVTGPHLHFEVRTTPYYGSDVDPVAYLQAHGVSV